MSVSAISAELGASLVILAGLLYSIGAPSWSSLLPSKRNCKIAAWVATCVTVNLSCVGLLYLLPRESLPTTCSAQVEHSISGDPI